MDCAGPLSHADPTPQSVQLRFNIKYSWVSLHIRLCPCFVHMKCKVDLMQMRKFTVQSSATYIKGEAGLVAANPRTFQCPNDLLLGQVETLQTTISFII